jgi:hypothetical protein
MGLFSSSKNKGSSDSGRTRDQADPKWSFRGGGHRPSGRAVAREQRRQNPNGFRRSGRW